MTGAVTRVAMHPDGEAYALHGTYEPTPAECDLLGLPRDDPPALYAPVGCDQCRSLGYSGRTGLFELIPVNDTLREMIHERSGEHELEAEARRLSPSIHQDGRRRLLNGDTSLEEILRVTQESG